MRALIGSYTQPYRTHDVKVVDNFIYLLDEYAGLYILKHEGTTPVLHVQNEASNLFKMFPNPAQDYLNIYFSASNGQTYTMVMQNLSGKILYNHQIQIGGKEMQMNLSNLPPGVYLLTLKNKNRSQTEKSIRLP